MGALDGLSNALYGTPDMGDTRRLLEENKRLYQNLELPDFSEYVPETYTTEAANAELIGEDPNLRSKQDAALERMLGLSENGLSAEDELAFMTAKDNANSVASRGRAAALQNAEARGIGGSGLEFAMNENALQDASEMARKSGVEQAAASARNRVLANQAYQSSLGNLRSQDFGVNQANTNILNNFNQANTQNRNQASQMNTQNRNQAQQYNNSLKQDQYGNELNRVNGMTGQNQAIGNTYAAEQAATQANNNNLTGALVGVGTAAYMGGKK